MPESDIRIFDQSHKMFGLHFGLVCPKGKRGKLFHHSPTLAKAACYVMWT